MKLEIKHRYSGAVLFSAEVGSLKLAIEAAVRGGADLRGASLIDANLIDANLGGADLTGADLGGANLTGASLIDANLRGANLRGAYLIGANLTDAYLRGAHLIGADLRGAKGINPDRCTPLRILLEQPEKIRAYKLVQTNGEGPYARSNGYDPIKYEIGQSYEVGNACTDENILCDAGISLATLDWCIKEWREGYRILVAEFEAKDIAAIPTATDGKFRVFRCRIVGEKDLKAIGLTGEDKNNG